MKEKAYKLQSNIRRLSFMERGDAYDLKAFDFSQMAEIREVHQKRTLDLPAITFFYQYSTPEYVKELDSLHSFQTNCIYSRRMIDALLSVQDFEYHSYPIAVLKEGAVKFQSNPDGYKTPEPYEDPNFFESKSLRDDLFIFQTLEFLDVFDWDKSDYRQSESDRKRNRLGDVTEYVFKEPVAGFPPLFRLINDPVSLFISAEAREALKKAGIRGSAFLSLRGYRPDSQLQIDVPIA